MKKYRILTGTVTYAFKGRDILRKNGYDVYTDRITSTKSGMGCGYTLNFKGDIDKAVRLLKDADIRILEIKEL